MGKHKCGECGSENTYLRKKRLDEKEMVCRSCGKVETVKGDADA